MRKKHLLTGIFTLELLLLAMSLSYTIYYNTTLHTYMDECFIGTYFFPYIMLAVPGNYLFITIIFSELFFLIHRNAGNTASKWKIIRYLLWVVSILFILTYFASCLISLSGMQLSFLLGKLSLTALQHKAVFIPCGICLGDCIVDNKKILKGSN